MINDQLVVSRLIHHYVSTLINKDRVKGLWVFLLISRSLVGISLVLEDSIFFQILLDTPWLWKFCVFACIFTPSLQDSEKGLAVLKFILDNSGELAQKNLVLGEALSLATSLELVGHVEILAPLCSEEKKASAWIEIESKEKSTLSIRIQSLLSNSVSSTMSKLLCHTQSLVQDETDPATKYLKFERLVLEYSGVKGYCQTLRDIWCVLNEQCIKMGDSEGVQRFAGFYSLDDHLILPLSQFDLALSKGLDSDCDVLIPMVDCIIPGSKPPAKLERFSILFTEYCKTPKKILFSQLNYPPVFSSLELAKSKKKVIEHQLAVVSFLYRSLKAADSSYKPQSTDVWESIQVGNAELSTLLQKWGGTAAWMEAADFPEKPRGHGESIKKKDSEDYSDYESDVDSQSGMFMAFDGGKSGFAETMRMSNSHNGAIICYPFNSSKPQNRVNIFESDQLKNSGYGSSLLGARRINQVIATATETEKSKSQRGSESYQQHTAAGQYNQQSNQIWELYFKSDLKKLQNLMIETSLTNFDWMEFQVESNILRGSKLKDKNLVDGLDKSSEDQALLQKYTQLY